MFKKQIEALEDREKIVAVKERAVADKQKEIDDKEAWISLDFRNEASEVITLFQSCHQETEAARNFA